MRFYGEYYYTIDYGILLYSKAIIYERQIPGSATFNHTFIRELNEYTDFSEEITEETDDTFENFFINPTNIVAISIIIFILIATPAAFWIIHRQKVKRDYQYYKATLRDKKGKPPQKTQDKQKKSKKTL